MLSIRRDKEKGVIYTFDPTDVKPVDTNQQVLVPIVTKNKEVEISKWYAKNYRTVDKIVDYLLDVCATFKSSHRILKYDQESLISDVIQFIYDTKL